MNTNEELITSFYRSFSVLDASGMNHCYSDDIVFFDPVFDLLNGREVFAMWQMLCKNAMEFSLTFGNIQALGEDYYTCDWMATYTFSKTGRHVVNNVKAHMKIIDGKIIEHSDAFSLHQWSRQALGFSGWLFGWNSYYRQRIKNSAKRSLVNYMEQ